MDTYQKFGVLAIVISIPFVIGSFFNQGQGIIFTMGLLYGLIFIFHSRIEKIIIPKINPVRNYGGVSKSLNELHGAAILIAEGRGVISNGIKKPLIFYGLFVFLSGLVIESLAYFNNLANIKAGQRFYLFSPDYATDVFIKGIPHYFLIALFLAFLVRKYYLSVFELGFILWIFWAGFVDQFSHLQALLRGNVLDFTTAGLLMVFGLHWPLLLFHNSLNEAYPQRSKHWFKYPAAFIYLILSAFILTVVVFGLQRIILGV